MPTAEITPDVETAARLRAVIGKLARRLRPTAAAARAGLTPTQVSVLLNVMREGPIRLSDLAASEALNPTMLSRVVAGMVQEGLVERWSDPADRRAGWVEATVVGRRLAERMRRERTQAVTLALGQLSDADRHRIEAAVPALEHLAETLGGKRPGLGGGR